jgi:hypothetical protein
MLILTANYRRYDTAKPVPGLIVYSEARRDNTHLSGRYLGKAPKCAPHLLGHEDPDIIWIDGSMRWTGEDLAGLLALVPHGGVGMYRHRFRTCVYEEAAASHFYRYDGEPIDQQAEHYRRQGHPEHWGLWEAGIIVWRGAHRAMGAAWLAEQLAWTSQDQISLPVVLRRLGVTVTDLAPGNVVDNPWFKYEEHLRGAQP